MGKLLFWVVVIAVLWFGMSLLRVSQRRAEQREVQRRHEREADARPQRIVACAHCGLHLPWSEAVHGRGTDDSTYCCIEHRDAQSS